MTTEQLASKALDLIEKTDPVHVFAARKGKVIACHFDTNLYVGFRRVEAGIRMEKLTPKDGKVEYASLEPRTELRAGKLMDR